MKLGEFLRDLNKKSSGIRVTILLPYGTKLCECSLLSDFFLYKNDLTKYEDYYVVNYKIDSLLVKLIIDVKDSHVDFIEGSISQLSDEELYRTLGMSEKDIKDIMENFCGDYAAWADYHYEQSLDD